MLFRSPGKWKCYVNSSIKQQISAFGLFPYQTVAATPTVNAVSAKIMDATSKTLTYAIDTVRTDLGDVDIVYSAMVPQAANTSYALDANNITSSSTAVTTNLGVSTTKGTLCLAGRAFFIKDGFLEVAMLDDIHYGDVGIRGQSMAGSVVAEGTIKVLSSKAHAVITGWNNYSPYTQ